MTSNLHIPHTTIEAETVPTTDVPPLEPSHVTAVWVMTESQFLKDTTKTETIGASSSVYGFEELDPQQDIELLEVRPRVRTERGWHYKIDLQERISEPLSPYGEIKLTSSMNW